MGTTDQLKLPLSAEELGSWVRRRRTIKSITQQELAEQIGISRQALARLEKGSPDVRLSTALEAVKYLSERESGA
uniref:helix-turn-helix transcriptional regulator n=1 Tax=Vaginimicrobium propionicum TaxID=1871034 RepID=UPI000970AB2B